MSALLFMFFNLPSKIMYWLPSTSQVTLCVIRTPAQHEYKMLREEKCTFLNVSYVSISVKEKIF